MAGFSSMDDLISKMTVSGQSKRIDWNKNFLPTTNAVAGEWSCLFRGAGNPGADTIGNTGTTRAFQTLSDTTAGAIPHGGNVSPATKHIISASAFTAAATTAPCIMMLVDMLGFYRCNTPTTTGAQACDNTVTLTRYTSGQGVMAFAYANNATPMGAGTPSLALVYTNSEGVSGRATPTVLPVCKTAAANGLILYSGTGAGKYGPFIPLQAGDSGISSIQSISISATYTSGEWSTVLCRPLLTLPITTLGVAAERDLVNQLPSMPQIVDGACLVWLMYHGANTVTNNAIFGHLAVAWG
jgi:hypothetical protein